MRIIQILNTLYLWLLLNSQHIVPIVSYSCIWKGEGIGTSPKSKDTPPLAAPYNAMRVV
ncbi:hypothetical protein HanXRQr2_Chr04g0149161 [Helianthus annuus]|uniref:Uncharacterized protein n=1 Tax=Helianthus annuus TaxID=4232 RepID=A0A251UZ31_HELAN|nr:hypothetical protein HanXRQr2_Chr04g0149161 [Helianthus annuus]